MQKHTTFFNLSLDLCCIARFSGIFVELNPAWECLGYTRKELMTLPFLHFVHPDDREKTQRETKALNAGKTTLSFENRYVAKDGSIRYFSWRAFASLQDQLIYAVARDLTLEKLAYHKLQQNEHNHQQALDAISDMIIVKDEGLRPLWANKAFRDFFAVSQDQLSDRPNVGGPVCRNAELDAMASVKPVAVPQQRLLRADGHPREFHTVYSPVIDQSGKAVQIVAVSRDITEKIQLDESLAREKEEASRHASLLECIFESIGEGILVADQDGMVIKTNQAATRILAREGVGKRVGDFFSGYDVYESDKKTPIQLRDRPIFLALEGKSSDGVELIIKRSGTSAFRSLNVSGRPLHKAGKQTGGGLIVFRETTQEKTIEEERARLNAQLVQASKLASLGTLSAGVAHELNNPLVAVRGYAQLISMSDQATETMKIHADEIVRASLRMQKIIDHLRTFGRQSKPEDRAPFSLNEVISNALLILEKQLLYQGIRVRLDLDDDIFILGDSVKMESVFQNLLTNARDAFEQRPPGCDPLISISTKREGAQAVTIIFGDNGAGMSAETLELLFDPFFTTKPTGKGTGLGLSIVHGIIEEHGGTIRVESAPGRGTEFTLRFPTLPGPTLDLPKEETCASDPPPAAGIKPKILVVDDDEQVVKLLTSFLQDEYDVETIVDARIAIDRLKEQSYQMVLTDLKMPGTSGLDILNAAKKFQPDVAVVVMSGNIGEQESEKLVDSGAVALLEKPFPSPEQLKNVLRRYLPNRSFASSGSNRANH